MIETIEFKDVYKIIETEAERLNKLTQQQGNPLKDESIAGYIVGMSQLKANLQVLLGNRETADKDDPVCWKCGNLLETKDGKDYNQQAVKICCECGAFIRD